MVSWIECRLSKRTKQEHGIMQISEFNQKLQAFDPKIGIVEQVFYMPITKNWNFYDSLKTKTLKIF